MEKDYYKLLTNENQIDFDTTMSVLYWIGSKMIFFK